MQREAMEFDMLIVVGGPAGLAPHPAHAAGAQHDHEIGVFA